MVKRVFTVPHRDPHATPGPRERSAGVCRENCRPVPAKIRLHCACALILSPHFKFCRMSQSLGQKNPSPAHRGCAFLLHLSVIRNQDPISFECFSSRAHVSSFLVNVPAPACPVHRICCACASILIPELELCRMSLSQVLNYSSICRDAGVLSSESLQRRSRT